MSRNDTVHSGQVSHATPTIVAAHAAVTRGNAVRANAYAARTMEQASHWANVRAGPKTARSQARPTASTSAAATMRACDTRGGAATMAGRISASAITGPR